jgi:hypothetical protein
MEDIHRALLILYRMLKFNYMHNAHQVLVSLAAEQGSPQSLQLEVILGVAIVAVVLCLALGLLVGFIKMK